MSSDALLDQNDHLIKNIPVSSRCRHLPGLYIVGTPLGNLEDITLRALYLLRTCDGILCEDTRTTGVLLHQYGIHKPCLSYHTHNEHDRIDHIIERLERQETWALVSDGGMPLMSDPGLPLLRKVIEKNIHVSVIPGPTAPITALVLSGLPVVPFTFLGFLPTKSQSRQKILDQMNQQDGTLVAFESPHRILKTVGEMANKWPLRVIVVARELTKQFETFYRGTAQEVHELLQKETHLKGEFVLMLGPQDKEGNEHDWMAALEDALKHYSLKESTQKISQQFDVPRNIVYKHALTIKED
jgi:16S rRNA (cytidine1402-2'-O)-methyltransferase